MPTDARMKAVNVVLPHSGTLPRRGSGRFADRALYYVSQGFAHAILDLR
jgi:hypothetical protein